VVTAPGRRDDVAVTRRCTEGEAQRQQVALILSLAVTTAVAALAAVSDSRAIDARPGTTAVDVTVGVVFALAGALARAPRWGRLLSVGIGAAWLAGSLFASMRTLHQALLLVALALYPTGRTRKVPQLLLAAVAVLVALQVLPQLVVAGVFAVLAVAILARDSRGATVTAYPVTAAIVVAGALGFAWWTSHRGEVGPPLAVYEGCLLAVAAGYPLGHRLLAQHASGLADQMLRDPESAGLPGLQRVLAGALADPGLQIECWDATTAAYLPVDRDAQPHAAGETVLVTEHGGPLARVVTSSPAVMDRPTAAAVREAVRLAVLNDRLHAELDDRGAELARSRRRLVAATDQERERTAAQLNRDVGPALERALSSLTVAASHAPIADAVGASVMEVAAARADVARIVAGVPPVALGQGQLAGGLRLLAARSPLPVTVTLDEEACADAQAETALFYVCSEALTNAVKHAQAQSVTVRLAARSGELELSVQDDGTGGADATGSGLLGLADRLAAVDGNLTIDSTYGAGTTVVARVPTRR